MKIEVGKYYKTRDGKKAYVIGVNPLPCAYYGKFVGVVSVAQGHGGEEFDPATTWDKHGNFCKDEGPSEYDLVTEWKEPASGTHWLNVYRNKGDSQVWHANYRTRQMADDAAANYSRSYEDERLACIEVPWTEGQGLEAGK